jgi:uncharacterized protein
VDPKSPLFLGIGWRFPPEFIGGAAAYACSMVDDRIDIEQSLHILLSTTPGERIMQPKYGCDLTPLLFEPVNTTLQTIIADRVRTSILYY